MPSVVPEHNVGDGNKRESSHTASSEPETRPRSPDWSDVDFSMRRPFRPKPLLIWIWPQRDNSERVDRRYSAREIAILHRSNETVSPAWQSLDVAGFLG